MKVDGAPKLLRRGIRAVAIVFIFIAVSRLPQATAQQTGSRGDQGDGTCRNPILNADYPDVDVEQLGDTYLVK